MKQPKIVPLPPQVRVECGTCRFYRKPPAVPGGGIVRSGACRRYPELTLKDANDWCGEWSKA